MSKAWLGTQSAEALIQHVRAFDKVQEQRMARAGLPAGVIPGIKSTSGADMVSKMMEIAHSASKGLGIETAFEVEDNAVLTIHYRRGKLQETIRAPIVRGMVFQGRAKELLRPSYAQIVSTFYKTGAPIGTGFGQAAYMAPGFVKPTKTGAEFISLGEMVTSTFKSAMERIPATDVRGGLREAASRVRAVYETGIWSKTEGLGGLMPFDSPASVLHASRIRVLTPEGKLYIPPKGKFPITKTGYDPSIGVRPYREMREYYQQAGIYKAGLTDIGMKAETAMGGWVTALTPPHLTPFGQEADPTRQLYQQWHLRPLLRRRNLGLSRPWVSTRAFEAAADISGGGKQYWAPTKTLYTVDPRIEAAVGASAGGLVVSKAQLKRMAYEIGGQRRTPGVGQAFILTGGGKGTVAATAESMTKGIGIIASTRFLGKSPHSLKSDIVSNILASLGKVVTTSDRPSDKTKLKFLQEVAQVVGATPVIRGNVPGLEVSPEAILDDERVNKVVSLIRSYNKGALGARPRQKIPEFIEQISTDVTGAQGVIPGVRGWMIHGGAALRHQQETFGEGAVDWTIGRKAAQRVRGTPAQSLFYSPIKGRGIKIQTRDILNLYLQGGKASTAIADMLTKAVEGANVAEKEDIWKVFAPLLGHQRVAGGINIDTLNAAKFAPLPRGKDYYTAAELAGTALDPAGAMYKNLTVNLPGPVEVAGRGLTQVHLPAPATLGFGPTQIPAQGATEIGYYISPLQRAREKVLQDIQEGTYTGDISKWFRMMAKAATGKKGILRDLSSARLGASGYWRLVPFGTGAAAAALGSNIAGPGAVPDIQRAVLSSETVRSLGPRAAAMFRQELPYKPKGTAWMLLSSQPSQGPAHLQMVLAREAAQAEKHILGPNQVGVLPALEGLMRRDNDADNIAALFIGGRRGQRLAAEMASQTAPELAATAAALSDYTTAEQKFLQSLGASPSTTDPHNIHYREYAKLAHDKVTFEQTQQRALADDLVQKMYGTKVLTPPTDWWSHRQRAILASMGDNAGVKEAALVYDQVVQMSLAKGAAANDAAVELVSHFTRMSKETLQDPARMAVETGYIKERVLKLRAAALADATKKGHLEGALAALSEEKLEAAYPIIAKVSLYDRQAMNDVALRFSGSAPISGERADLDKLLKYMSSLYEDPTTEGGKVFNKYREHTAKAIGLTNVTKGAGMEAIPAIAPMPAAQAAINEIIQEEGRKYADLPSPIIDRVAGWFRNPEVANYKKAGILVGGGLFAAAAIKNMLFPGYTSTKAEGSTTSIAIPIPVEMPSERPAFDSIFDRTPNELPVDSSSSMAMPFANMGSRTPLPAVRIGMGMLQPGSAPLLTGNFMKGPTQAPMALNVERHEMHPGSPVRETARVGLPREAMASTYHPVSVEATRRSDFDVNKFMREVPEANIRLEVQPDESERNILRAFEEQEMSNFT